jgi:hypothetical protein
MNIIQSPAVYETRLNVKTRLFLAGGISNCPDWQKEMSDKLWKKIGEVAVFNPRRVGDLAKDTEDAKTQIEWENWHLHKSNRILFWFPEETLCPITLFELGKWSAYWMFHMGYLRHHMFIGVHPNYQRRFDVETQIGMMDKYMKIHYSLDDLFDDVVQELQLV